MAKNNAERVQYPEICQEKYRFEPFDAVFIDVDSCLTGIEGIDEMAILRGKDGTVAQLTKEAMNGTIPFQDVFARRLDIINPTRDDLTVIAQRYQGVIVPDARETIKLLQDTGKRVFLISGGYKAAIDPLAETLGIPTDRVFANELYFDDDGEYAGFDTTNPLCRTGGKREVIARLKKDGQFFGRAVIIGDGMSEVEAREEVDLCIGFGGFQRREAVVENADLYIWQRTLAPLVPLILGPDEAERMLWNRQTRLLTEWGLAALTDAEYNGEAQCLRDDVTQFVTEILGPDALIRHAYWCLVKEFGFPPEN